MRTKSMFSFRKSLAAFAGMLIVSMLVVNVIATTDSAAQEQKNQLEGVWKVTEVVLPAPNPADKGTTITTPQPGLLIFTKGYYSGMAVTAAQPRPAADEPKDAQNLTDVEKIARYDQWRQFIANAGKYEVKGSTLLMHAMVAKNPNVMTSTTPLTWELKMEGASSFWLIPPSDRAATDARVKFTRLE